MTTFHRKRREYVGFSHSELKYVGLHGCVGTINVRVSESSFEECEFTYANDF